MHYDIHHQESRRVTQLNQVCQDWKIISYDIA